MGNPVGVRTFQTHNFAPVHIALHTDSIAVALAVVVVVVVVVDHIAAFPCCALFDKLNPFAVKFRKPRATSYQSRAHSQTLPFFSVLPVALVMIFARYELYFLLASVVMHPLREESVQKKKKSNTIYNQEPISWCMQLPY